MSSQAFMEVAVHLGASAQGLLWGHYLLNPLDPLLSNNFAFMLYPNINKGNTKQSTTVYYKSDINRWYIDQVGAIYLDFSSVKELQGSEEIQQDGGEEYSSFARIPGTDSIKKHSHRYFVQEMAMWVPSLVSSTGPTSSTGQAIYTGKNFISLGRSMEDRWTVKRYPEMAFFLVFDGHSGAQTSSILERYLSHFIYAGLRGLGLLTVDGEPRWTNYWQTLFDNFEKLFCLPNGPEWGSFKSGSTLSGIIIGPQYIHILNLGDSQTILLQPYYYVTPLHNPNAGSPEATRVSQFHGYHVSRDRVNGALAVSRGFGDFSYKNVDGIYSQRGPVSLQVDVVTLPRPSSDRIRFLVTSDGYPDTRTYQRDPLYNGETIAETFKRASTLPLEECWDLLGQELEDYLSDPLNNQDDITVILGEIA